MLMYSLQPAFKSGFVSILYYAKSYNTYDKLE